MRRQKAMAQEYFWVFWQFSLLQITHFALWEDVVDGKPWLCLWAAALSQQRQTKDMVILNAALSWLHIHTTPVSNVVVELSNSPLPHRVSKVCLQWIYEMMLMMSETMTTQALLQKSFVGEPEEGSNDLQRIRSWADSNLYKIQWLVLVVDHEEESDGNTIPRFLYIKIYRITLVPPYIIIK